MRKVQGTIILVVLSAFMGSVIGIKAACTEPDGSLDVTFGNHGIVVTPIGLNSTATGVVVLPCGDIVAAGVTISPGTDGDFALARYTPYGVLNTSFGTNGVVLTDFATVLAPVSDSVVNNPSLDGAAAIALQKNCDGCDDVCDNRCSNSCNINCKLVVVGSTDVFGPIAIAVARYNCDGTLDTSFGIGGTGVTVIPTGGTFSGATSVAIQQDGKIVIAGIIVYADGSSDFMVVRLNCDGTLDRTFGCDRSGVVIIDFGGSEEGATAVKIQQDGKIVVAGFSNVNGTRDFALARLTPNGRLDRTFGDKEVNGFGRTGKAVTSFPGDEIAHGLVLVEGCGTCCNADQVSIVVVGQGGAAIPSFTLAGFTSYGELDMHFGQNGFTTTVFPGSISSNAQAALLEHNCGAPCKILAVGSVSFSGRVNDFALARYTLDGNLDENFGNGGLVSTSFSPGSNDIANAVDLQENGDIVVAGGSDNSFALARYNVCDPCCTLCGLQCATCTPCP